MDHADSSIDLLGSQLELVVQDKDEGDTHSAVTVVCEASSYMISQRLWGGQPGGPMPQHEPTSGSVMRLPLRFASFSCASSSPFSCTAFHSVLEHWAN